MSLKPNTKAPGFSLYDTEGRLRTLSNENNTPIALFFFPLAFTSISRKILSAVRDNKKIYKSANFKVFGISVDSHFSLKQFKKNLNINFSLLSDFNRVASESYGILDDSYFPNYNSLARTSVFVIDGKGVIRFSDITEDANSLPDFSSLQASLFEIEE